MCLDGYSKHTLIRLDTVSYHNYNCNYDLKKLVKSNKRMNFYVVESPMPLPSPPSGFETV